MSSRAPLPGYFTDRLPGKLSALLDLGLERIEPPPVTTESVRLDRSSHKLTQYRPAMGTFISVTAIHGSEARAAEAIGAALAEMDRLVAILNRFDEASALTELNRHGRIEGPPPELARVVGRALHYHRLSGGVFDASVKPLVDLLSAGRPRAATPAGNDGPHDREGASRGHGREETVPLQGREEASVGGRFGAAGSRPQPDPRDLRAALELVGSEHIELTQRAIGFGRSGMGITLDGIAKGYVVDEVAETLVGHGVRSYLINAGGDIRTAGRKGNRLPWTVAVQDPDKRDDFPDIIELEDGAVATSGSYEIYFDRERLFHHIVSSRTGESPLLNSSVSVLAPTTMAADALATALFVMEPAEGLRFIESRPRCECLIVDANGRQLRSRGWRSAKHTPS